MCSCRNWQHCSVDTRDYMTQQFSVRMWDSVCFVVSVSVVFCFFFCQKCKKKKITKVFKQFLWDLDVQKPVWWQNLDIPVWSRKKMATLLGHGKRRLQDHADLLFWHVLRILLQNKDSTKHSTSKFWNIYGSSFVRKGPNIWLHKWILHHNSCLPTERFLWGEFCFLPSPPPALQMPVLEHLSHSPDFYQCNLTIFTKLKISFKRSHSESLEYI
jgi:hypothetical protein